MSGYIYGWVSTALPGYRTISETSGTPAVAASNVALEFRDWVALSWGAYTVAWSPADERVTVTPTDLARSLVATDAALVAMGVLDRPGATAAVAGERRGYRPPPLAIPCRGVSWQRVDYQREQLAAIDRGRRQSGYTYGGARVFDVRLTMTRESFDSLQDGWCLRGRVTIETGNAAEVGSAEPDGTLTGTVMGVVSTRWLGQRRDLVDVVLAVAQDSGLSSDPWVAAEQIGYHPCLAQSVSGISQVMREALTYDLDAAGASVATSGDTDGLWLDGQSLSWELDRETGIAAGRALESVVTYDAIAQDLPDTFRRPSITSQLAADIDEVQTTVTLDSAAAWPASGTAYIGREVIEYAAKTATQLTGCTRGADGSMVQLHSATGIGVYSQATDRVSVWPGRLVRLVAHLCAPDGRLLATDWPETESDTARTIWLGTVSDPPRPVGAGMMVRSLPVERVMEKPVGVPVEFEVSGEQLYSWAGGEQVTARVEWSTAGVGGYAVIVGPTSGLPAAMASLGEYAAQVQAAFDTQLAAATADVEIDVIVRGEVILLHIELTGADTGSVAAVMWPDALLSLSMASDRFDGFAMSTASDAGAVFAPARAAAGTLVLVPLEADQVVQVPAAGFMTVDGSEVIEYEGAAVSSGGQYLTISVIARRVQFTGTSSSSVAGDLSASPSQRLRPGMRLAVSWVFAGGLYGSVSTLLASSGTGLRNAYDTLPAGDGYGLPYTLITPDGVDSRQTIAASGEQVGEDLVGGWLALRRQCLVSRRTPYSGSEFTLAIVDTSPAPGDDLSAADICLTLTDSPEQVPGPNRISIDDGAGGIEAVDWPRLQQEGEVSVSYSAPGISRTLALGYAAGILARGAGEATIEVIVPGWSQVQPGDALTVTLAHPRTWDWDAGTRAPSSIRGRVVAVSADLTAWQKSLTILMEGRAPAALLLCPTATVVSTVASTITVDDASSFLAGEVVRIYRAGSEATYDTTTTASAISGNVLTVGAVPAWLAAGDRVTFPAYAAASARVQDGFAFVRSDREWR